MDAIAPFRQAMVSIGLPLPDTIHGDGQLHRYSTDNKPTHKNGWYFLHLDGVPWGQAGSWDMNGSDAVCHWCAKSDTTLTQAERDTQRAQQKAVQMQREAQRRADHDAAADMAQAIWDAAQPVETGHGYLTAKGIHPNGTRLIQAIDAHRLCNRLSPQLHGALLVIPMRNAARQLRSLQFITEDGVKRPLTGGEKQGCYFAMGSPKGQIIICEGFATGASLAQCTGDAVAVAFDAGNLCAAALALNVKSPALKIIIAADDDHLSDGNPGLTKATAAALAVGGLLAVPAFGADRPDKATDFNDLHQIAGDGAVKACMDAAIHPVAVPASDTGAKGRIDLWPEPTPLPNALPPVDPFDAELLPVALRAWVMDIAHRMQCPPDFPAVAALVALSSLIGARAVIQPKAKDDWQVVPNLWGAVIGRPGVKKSPALGEALRPLNRLQANETELHQAAHEAWALDCKVTAMQDDANEKKAKGIAGKDPAGARALLQPVDTPGEPTARRFIVNDATVEKLGELMQQNPWGTLSYRDELYGLLTGLDKPGQEGARAFMLQSYDGNQGYTFDRIGRGTVHIPRVCLAMIGGIQPGRIQEYVRGAVAGGSADDGLLQRFGLTVWPDNAGEFVHVDQWPDTPAKQTAWAVFERLAALQPANDSEPVVWRFDDAAQALFVEWLVPFEIELRGDDLHPAMVSHLSKYRKLIPALALVFALIDTPDSDGVIHEGELLRALAMGDYLRSHANRLYAAAVMPETTDAATLLSRIKAGKLVDRDGVILDSFTPRQIALKHWAGLGTPDAVRKAADVLADYDWLRRDVVLGGASGGRPSDRYTINPRARGAA
jgi:putative DNA primase/helicase